MYPVLRLKQLNFEKLECHTPNYGAASTTRRTSQIAYNKKDLS